jgi:hypothetical protein
MTLQLAFSVNKFRGYLFPMVALMKASKKENKTPKSGHSSLSYRHFVFFVADDLADNRPSLSTNFGVIFSW